MRDPERIPEVLDTLRRVWTRHPDLRLSQLLISAAAFGAPAVDPFYVEDRAIVAGLTRLEADPFYSKAHSDPTMTRSEPWPS